MYSHLNEHVNANQYQVGGKKGLGANIYIYLYELNDGGA